MRRRWGRSGLSACDAQDQVMMTTPSDTPRTDRETATPRTDAREKETVACNASVHAHYGWKLARILERELAESEKRNFALAAGQCIVNGGLRSDEHGNQYCSIAGELSAATARAEKAEAYARAWSEDFIKLEPEMRSLVEWAKNAKQERDEARATIATLTSQLAEAQRLLHRAYPYIEDAQADATSDESLLAIRTLLSDINAAMKDTHGNA